MSHFTALNKNSCLQRIKFFLWIFSISNLLRKVIFLSNSDLFEQKENFSVYFPEYSSKLQESIVCLYMANFEEKNIFLLTFVHFYWFEKIKMFKPIKIFLWIFPFFKLVEKNKLSEYFSASFWESLLLIKREVFSEISRKCCKTTGKHILAVCG